MKHRIVFLLALLGLVSCSGQKTALEDSDRTSLIQMIESHDNTLIYIWADYDEEDGHYGYTEIYSRLTIHQ